MKIKKFHSCLCSNFREITNLDYVFTVYNIFGLSRWVFFFFVFHLFIFFMFQVSICSRFDKSEFTNMTKKSLLQWCQDIDWMPDSDAKTVSRNDGLLKKFQSLMSEKSETVNTFWNVRNDFICISSFWKSFLSLRFSV